MKKRIFMIVLTFTLSIIMLVSATQVNGEEIGSDGLLDSTEQIITDTNENAVETNSKENNLGTWFIENIGWIFGASLGVVISALSEILTLYKKAKEYKESREENKNLKETFANDIELYKEIVSQSKALVNATDDSLRKISTKIGINNANVDKLMHSFNTLSDNLDKVYNRLGDVEKCILMIAQNSEELVANNTSENITKLIG